MSVRLLTAIICCAVFIFTLGCGGGAGTTSTLVSGPDAAGTGLDPTVEFPDAGTGYPVRMQPQPVVESPFRGVSQLDPATWLNAIGTPVRSASYTANDLTRTASAWDPAVGANRVTAQGDNALFAPNWAATGGNTADDLAFCSYRFSASGFSDDADAQQTIGLTWAAGAPPADYDDLWLGIFNWDLSQWDWYRGPTDNTLTIETFAPYENGSGIIVVAVALVGTDPATLARLEVGQAEVRTGGAIPGGEEANTDPPLFGAIEGPLPDAVDLTPGCSPVNDQGTIQSCTAFAVGDAAYNYELNSIYAGEGWNFSDPFNLTSPRYLYIETGKAQGYGSPYEGRNTQGVITFLEASGVATELNAPYGSRDHNEFDISDDWSAEALADAALLRADDWTSVNPAGEVGVNTIKAVLAFQQRPLVFQTGLDWSFFSYPYNQDAVWEYVGPVVAYHCMCIVGYDDARGAFKVRNSWGTDWGNQGYCWVGYDTVEHAPWALHQWCWTVLDDYNQAVAGRFVGSPASIPAPGNVQASDGLYGDRIEVTWSASAGADGYRVYRDVTSELVAELGAGETAWNDTGVGALDGLTHVYWVRATQGAGLSPLSAPDTGYSALAPEIASVSPTAGPTGSTTEFTAQVYGTTPLTYAWDFGGGATPNTTNDHSPQVILGGKGHYNASLTVANAHGIDQYNFSLYIGDVLVVNSVQPAWGDPSSVQTFTASVAGMTPIQYYWEFGGGTIPDFSSSAGALVIMGAELGVYQGTLTVGNAWETVEYGFQYSVGEPPVVNGVTPQSGDVGAAVTFVPDVSGDGTLSYSWDFGGGATPNTSSAAQPNVTLGVHGLYSASLTVTSVCGEDIYGFDLVVGEPPTINDVDPQSGGVGQEVTFTADVSGLAPLTYAWDFGGGATPNTSSDPSPTVTLSTVFANYDASLTVTNASGEDTYEFTLTVAFDIQADTVYAIPQQFTVGVNEPVTIVVHTGVTANGFNYLNGVSVTMNDDAEYVSGSFNLGAIGGAAQESDGIWALMSPQPSTYFLPSEISMACVGFGVGRVYSQVNITPIGGGDIREAGDLYNIQYQFSEPGTKKLGFLQFLDVKRTYYMDNAATEYYWGTLMADQDGNMNVTGAYNEITVTE